MSLLRRRVSDLFSDRTVSSRLVSMARKSVKGVENVYTQHTPLLANTLEAVARGRLPHMDYPFVGGAEASPTAAKVKFCKNLYFSVTAHVKLPAFNWSEAPSFQRRCTSFISQIALFESCDPHRHWFNFSSLRCRHNDRRRGLWWPS